MDVFFLFPGRVLIVFYLSLGSEQTKNPTGQKAFVSFGTFRRDTEFSFGVSILFLNCFSGTNHIVPSHNDGRAPARAAIWGTAQRFAVCFENSVPVASGAWHAQVWVKVSVRLSARLRSPRPETDQRPVRECTR